MEKKTIYIETDIEGLRQGAIPVTVHLFNDHKTYLRMLDDQYVFSKYELTQLISKIYDDVWGKTGQGWNGEMQPIKCMHPVAEKYFKENKIEYINSII